MDKGFRELKFKRHRARQKAVDSICKEARRKTIVGFGNWSNNDPGGIIKERPAGQVNALKERLCHCCPAVSIDKHR
ncbi:hypothetical protein H632_c1856p0 [Helicosporidium sp. ATCC 50920]|nr:hypothetical protein H632_c1856p0 [Helicosporidium sp. ATCC 50920]|eukprot:KDD73765.1 hypothetical protein H632_c1856p0 [Helicosporidium sp. ATCC 50920]